MTRARVLGILSVLLAAGVSLAGERVLSDVPSYQVETILPGDPRPPMTGGEFDTATLPADAGKVRNGANPVGGVPEYVWWYGCSPTSGGMMVGYWDGRPGYGNLYYGDASVWGGNGGSGTRSMVAGTAHIVSGQQNGYTYGDWHNSASYPTHQANPTSIADFMKTVDGGSYSADITTGLEAYVEWDNPATPVNESYQATAANIDVAYWGTPGQAFHYSNLKSEINANRPVLLNVLTYNSGWKGHSIVAYGYQDNMFQVKVPLAGGGTVDQTVGGFAVKDTWSNGTGQSDWYDWNYNVIYPIFSGGNEWWPFVELQGSSWTSRWDWMVSDAVTLDVVMPEPLSVSLVALAGLALLRRRKRPAA